MKTRTRVRARARPSVHKASTASKALTKVKIPSAPHVRAHREREKQKPDYDHEKVKLETRLRVAAIRARHPRCPLGRKCKETSCTLHPDRGRIRNKLSKVDRGLARRRKTRERKWKIKRCYKSKWQT